MFSESKKSRTKGEDRKDFTKEQNKISKGTLITGNIESTGAFRIEGTLKGNLKTDGKVVLSKTGVIEGEVECGSADLEGAFQGILVVRETLNLKSSCAIRGEVTTGKLSVEPGASLNGSCTMKGTLKTLQHEREEINIREKKQLA